MILQATTNGAISSDWTLTIAFYIIGFLLVTIATIVGRHFIRTLDNITERLNDHDDRIIELEKQDIRHNAELERIKLSH